MAEANTNESYLATAPLGSLMRKYSVPCVLSLLVGALYNIVDQLFIANADYLGSYGNAANSVVFPLTMVALSIATMLGDGCCAYVSLSLGAGNKDDAHRSIGTNILTIIGAGIVLMIIYLVLQEQILTLFGGRVNQQTFDMAKEYFFWITVGVPFYMFGQALNPIIRSDGSPRFAMVTLLIGSIMNVILDPIFIYGFHWGMMGAAVATILGQIVSAILSLWYLFHMKMVNLTRDSFVFRGGLLKKSVPLGLTSFMSQISVVFSMAVVNNMAKKYGALDPIFSEEQYAQIPTAVIGIVMKFFQIIISIAIGLSAGCIPVVGFNVGAGNNERVRKLLRLIIKAEVITGLVATVVFELFPSQVASLFGAANESTYYMDFAVRCIRIFLALLIISCVNKGAFIFLQSLGKALESTLLSMFREIVLGVGLPLLLPMFWGLDGLLLFMPVADAITFILVAYFLRKADRELASGSLQAAQPRSAAIEAAPAAIPDNGVFITIGRSYGSGGREIGQKVAKDLGIAYYDAELLRKTAESTGLSVKYLEDTDEKVVHAGALYAYRGIPYDTYRSLQGYANKAQKEIITKVASEGSCVIVGRRADRILAGQKGLLRVFIDAPLDMRAEWISKRDGLSVEESRKKAERVDRERAAYYNQLSSGKWGHARSYDLCINSGTIGADGAARQIEEAAAGLMASLAE